MARYKGIKGKFWVIFSEFIRKRDFYNHRRCITCGKYFETWQESQAGHYAPAGNCGFNLLFDEKNVHAECAYDNGFNSGHLIQYREGLIHRYKKGFVTRLEARYNAYRYQGETNKEWSKKEYETKIEEYKKKIDSFPKEYIL